MFEYVVLRIYGKESNEKMTEYEIIEQIPRFESSDGRNLSFQDSFIKEKLHKATYNRDIICLARGDGRSRIINDIVFHPEILFDWGEKSMHAFLEDKDERLRAFCDPNMIDKDAMIYYINVYGNKLNEYSRKFKILSENTSHINDFVNNLIEEVNFEENTKKLVVLKEWLFYALHTMGEREFSRITPWLSCSFGETRFDTASKFGRGRENHYYVIMDSWVSKCEENNAYMSMDYVNSILKEYELKWFDNRNNEIMLKYGIFPQQLVGYYFFDRGVLEKYVINKHYVDEWERNLEFEIGEPVYFEQTIDFNKLGPYNSVYEYSRGAFSVVGRRDNYLRRSL